MAHTLEGVHRRIAKKLSKADIYQALQVSRWLIQHVIEIDDVTFVTTPDIEIKPVDFEEIKQLADQLIEGVPFQRLVGTAHFYGLEFELNDECLVPRPDTEILVETIIDVWGFREALHTPNILDLGTGSGCILSSLLHEMPNASGVGVDLSQKALDMARLNAQRFGLSERVDWRQADMLDQDNEKLKQVIDAANIIVSNPPYIRQGDIEGLSDEVKKYDPLRALDGGADGLIFYRAIIDHLRNKKGGFLAGFEIGWDQSKEVSNLLNDAGFGEAAIVQDLAGKDRVILVDSRD